MNEADAPRRLLRVAQEFVVIAASVMAALAADEWRGNRLDHQLELQYLERLTEDVQADVDRLEVAQGALAAKRDPLARLVHLSPVVAESDLPRVAADLASGTNWGWNFPPANSATFEEMRSSGRLGLLRDIDLRSAVVNYYTRYTDQQGTIDARRTAFGPLSYELVLRPRVDGEVRVTDIPLDFEASPEAGDMLASTLTPARVDEVRNAATAELNWTQHALARVAGMLDIATALLARLEAR